MDKDIKDAVMAAFDGEPEDDAKATGEAAAAEAKASATVKPAAVRKKAVLGAGAMATRRPVPEAGPAAAAVAGTRPVVAAAPSRSAGAGLLRLVLAVVVVLAILAVIQLVQIAGLKAALARQDAALRELKSLARVTVSVYQEPGKRPQQVIASHALDDKGDIKPGRMVIRPLPEE